MIINSLFPEPESATVLPEGLYYEPDFLIASDQTDLLAMIDDREWNRELKRRVQHYGYRYDYKARRVDRSMRLGVLPEFTHGILSKLLAHAVVGCAFDQLIINEYLPGQGISAHIDCEPCFDDRIAIVSLGCAYEMEFQSTELQSVAVLMLAPGSLLALSGPARYQWTHQIRSRLKDHGVLRRRRVSLTFRRVLLSN
ncbi:MAG: alpha-ketoglutarate-dependent dioxygenase AlkB [Gemmataceae bacterium]